MPVSGSGRVDKAISCHAWSPDRKYVAISPNSSDVIIYQVGSTEPAQWKKVHTLTEHDSFVSGIDWSVDNMIVTCGHDRNAYVWNLVNNEWKPVLVILRISRAATMVKWSPSGKKFAVASGAKLVPVCHYEDQNKWWVSSLIKKHKSTVMSLDWHPNSKFLLTGSCDFRCRIFSAYLADVEPDVDADHWGSIFPQHNEFGELLWEFDQSSGWVESVAWSPSGKSLAWTSHDSSIFFANVGSNPQVSGISHAFLPFVNVTFLSNNTVVACGYNCNMFVFVNQGTPEQPDWVFVDKVDKEGNTSAKAESTGFKKNISKFQDSTSKGIAINKEALDTTLKTVHQNTVMQITPFYNKGVAKEICTTGIDGRLQVWDLNAQTEAFKLK